MRTKTLPFVLIAIMAAAVTTALVLNLQPTTTQANPILVAAIQSPVNPPAPEQIRVAITRAGLAPNHLAAAGVVQGEEVTSVVSAIESQLNANPGAVVTAEMTVGTARQSVADLERRIQAGIGSGEDITALATARASLASATTSRNTLLDGLFNAATQNLTEGKRTVLTAIRANAATWTLPVEFLTAARTEAQWLALRDALANERISAKLDVSPDPGSVALLAAVRAEPAVAAAISNLANLPAVQQAWQSASAN